MRNIYIGIDPGVETGIAVWDKELKKLVHLETLPLHRAFDTVLFYQDRIVKVIVEDARKRKYFGNVDAKQAKYGAGVREGSGSAKRDAKIWDDWLKDKGIEFEMKAPRNTKVNADLFGKMTGWIKRSSSHARDAAMMIINS